MRGIRRVFTLGSVLCAATVTLIATQAAPATATVATPQRAASTAATVHHEPGGALRSAMLATLRAGATGMIARVDDATR
jgi:hypothetical protein